MWDLTPTDLQKKSSNVDQLKGLLVKMPDGTFANAQTILGASNLGTGFANKISPGTLNTATDVINLKKQAKSLVVSNLDDDCDEKALKDFINAKMEQKDKITPGTGDFIDSLFFVKKEKSAFVTFRTEKFIAKALEANGTMYDGKQLILTRPPQHNLIGILGQNELGTADTVSSHVADKYVPDGPGKVFMAGLPEELGEQEVKELVATYGPLSSFFLPIDVSNGKSKGICFFIYEDISVTNDAVRGLNGIMIADNTLSVKLHTPKTKEDPAELLRKTQKIIVDTAKSERLDKPSRVLCLFHMITEDDLRNEIEFEDILEDIRSECENFGKVHEIRIPRDSIDPVEKEGVGKVFVKYGSVENAQAAKGSLEGRTFEKRTVFVKYFDERRFENRQYGKVKKRNSS